MLIKARSLAAYDALRRMPLAVVVDRRNWIISIDPDTLIPSGFASHDFEFVKEKIYDL